MSIGAGVTEGRAHETRWQSCDYHRRSSGHGRGGGTTVHSGRGHGFLGDVLEDEGRNLQAELNEAGVEALFLRLDVTIEEEWKKATDTTVSRYGRLDVLVNNAGISGSFHSDIMNTEAWDKLMEVNAKGVFLGIKHAIPEMRKVGGGSIVNISSISGFVGQDLIHMGYNASKGAVRILTKSAAIQYAKEAIRVNSVHPGLMSPMRSSIATGATSGYANRCLQEFQWVEKAGGRR